MNKRTAKILFVALMALIAISIFGDYCAWKLDMTTTPMSYPFNNIALFSEIAACFVMGLMWVSMDKVKIAWLSQVAMLSVLVFEVVSLVGR